jgi:transcriptional regulator with XRE-family HTH domain
MSKSTAVHASLPPIAAESLKKLGENLAIARVRRKQSQRAWAKRLGVSVPTLIRMEQGEPAVGVGIYATALWLMGRVQQLSELADPKHDHGALELDVRRAVRQRAVRSAASLRARLARTREVK